VHSVLGAMDEAYVRILGLIFRNGRSLQRESVWMQDLFRCGAVFWVINGQLLVGRYVRTHLSGFRVVWMGGNWIGRGLRSSVGDFSGVGRGYQAQDARYWLVHTILVGCSMQRRARMWSTNLWKGISDGESVQWESHHGRTGGTCNAEGRMGSVSHVCLMRNRIW
jgi:hypothetical protein